MLKLLLCDDHAVFRSGLLAALSPLEAEFLEAADAEQSFEALAAHADIDAVLFDLAMPGNERPWENLARIRTEYPTVPVVIISGSEEPETVRKALDTGAAGFIPKSSAPEIIRAAMRLVLDGGFYLPPQLLAAVSASPGASLATAAKPRGRKSMNGGPLTARQKEVAELLSKGLTNAEIASALRIAEGTVKTHVSAILDAFDVTNRTEAVLAIHESGNED